MVEGSSLPTTHRKYQTLSCALCLALWFGSAWSIPGCGLVAAATSAEPEADEPKVARPVGKPMTHSNLYPIRFGDTGRGSVIDGTTAATGEIVWSRETGKVSTSFWPANVLIWEGHPLVSTYDALALFDREGKRLWDRRTEGGIGPAVASDAMLYYKNIDRFIDSVDLEGNQGLESAPFPGGSGKSVRVDAFWPRPKDFIAVFYHPPADDRRLKPGDPEDKGARAAHVIVVRNDYPTRHGDWSTKIEAQPALVPLLVPGGAIVALMLGTDVVRVAPEDKKAKNTELSRFRSPLSEMTEWSVDAQEVFTLVGTEDDRKVLVAFAADGKTLWRWRDDKDDDTWAKTQPPIRLDGGRVCVLTEGRVLAIDAGKLAWAYDVRSEMLRHGSPVDEGSFEIKDGRLLAKAVLRHGTGLVDGSVLVTAGKTLLHLSATGKKLFSVTLDADILGAPVIDADGGVYVTTATHLFKLR